MWVAGMGGDGSFENSWGWLGQARLPSHPSPDGQTEQKQKLHMYKLYIK